MEYKKNSPPIQRFILFERAVKQLPGSYKLWNMYLKERVEFVVKNKHPISDRDSYEKVNMSFDRAVLLLHKMPRIWINYIQFLMLQGCITKTRRVIDQSLRSLPVTQHHRIWQVALLFARRVGGETAIHLYRRYTKLEKSKIEDLAEVLMALNQYDEAAVQLAKMIDKDIASSNKKTAYQIWSELCDLICRHPTEIRRLQVEAILRSGIARFTDQVGRLWCALGQYWILLGQFDKARDVFEEAMETVTTVRDFSQIFDAYTNFEESVLTSDMEKQALLEQDPNLDIDFDISLLDLRLLRFEKLMDRRPFLLNKVLLRQNPHNVKEWRNRVNLYKSNNMVEEAIRTFVEAIDTIQPKKVIGNELPLLWQDFAKFYEENNDLNQAREVFEKAVQVPYRNVEDLVNVWTFYVELELRHANLDEAAALLGRALSPPSNFRQIDFKDDSVSVQSRIFKSIKLWSLYVDLQESLGKMDATRAVYDKIFELKIATLKTIINYANYLEENRYFEDSFKVYERGLALFSYPVAFEIWNVYLTKFLNRFQGSKLERARDLFEQALDHCPAQYAKPIYLLYGKMEEDYGSARQALRIYDRATKEVGEKDRYEMYKFYIAKAGNSLGLAATREIYQRAVETLPDRQARNMCLEFADLEKKLGEIDRARALYGHSSQFCDPRTDSKFWEIWKEFEISHGNEETYKEMLRIKRSVETKFNTSIEFLSGQVGKQTDSSSITPGFVKSKLQKIEGTVKTESEPETNHVNPDEIDI